MNLKLNILSAILGISFLYGNAVAADIKIGIAAALTGNAAQYGLPIRQGLELAAAEINVRGGVNGNRLELIIEDEQGKKEEGINVFKKLIFQNKVMMLFGPTLSNSAQASDPVAQTAKVVVFGTSNTADGITSIGDYVFRNSVTERDILPITLKIAAQNTGLKKVAVIYGNDDIFTKSGYDNFKKALRDLKIPVATTETFAKGDVSFKPQLTNIRASNPDAVVLSALVAEGAPIMVQARQLGITLPFIGGNGMNSPRVFELAKGNSDNLWVGSPWSVESPAPENKRFIAAYLKAHGTMPDQFAAQAYDAMYIAAQALKTIKLTGKLETDRKALRDALPATQWNGATGPFKFRRIVGRNGKPAGYDAVQTAIVMVTQANRYVIKN
ncbi:MAG: ABC transporter substrate-binding protein [Deltaproteobacteria bacterium]|nr:ABC transporter substrate-binding protein [Deltaproteobacteria bacterium]